MVAEGDRAHVGGRGAGEGRGDADTDRKLQRQRREVSGRRASWQKHIENKGRKTEHPERDRGMAE